jgi:hypothetical protein
MAFSDWVAFGFKHDLTMNTEDEQALLQMVTACIATFPTDEN